MNCPVIRRFATCVIIVYKGVTLPSGGVTMSQFAPAPELPQHASQPPYILALDIGTSSVRALLFDATGTALPQVISQIPYDLTTSSDGESSVDADMLVELVAKTIDEALTKAGPLASRIGAMALFRRVHATLLPGEICL